MKRVAGWTLLCGASMISCGQRASMDADAGAAHENDVVASAEALARFEPTLLARLRPAREGFRNEGGRLTSVAYRAKAPGLLSDVPARADGAFSFGFARTPERQIHLRREGASEATAVLDQGRVIYRDVFASTDEIDVATDDALEILYLLRDKSAPTKFSWSVSLPAQLSKTAPAEDGGLEIFDGAGELRLRVPRPFVVDAHGVRRLAQLDATSDRWTLSFDPSGLEYPLLVDPIVETTIWKHDGKAPAPSYNSYAVAYAGKVLVVANGGTWEWDGTSYTLKGTAPAGLEDGAGLATLGSKVVLFGGRNSSLVNLDDTWEWDGTTWTKKTGLTPHPSARFGPAMTTLGGKVLLFGGTASNETWTYDGSVWAKLTPTTTSPSPRYGAAMAATGTKAVMFGGFGGTTLADTWEWDGADWAPKTSTGVTETNPKMTTVGTDTFLVTHPFGTGPAITYKWGGSSWTKLAPTNAPSNSSAHPLVAFGTKAVLLGGTTQGAHSFDGSNWSVGDPLYPNVEATTENGSKLIGVDYDGVTWDFDGTGWTKSSAPPVYVSTFGRALSMATVSGTPYLVDQGSTFSWDGSQWVPYLGGTAKLSAPGEGYAVASLGSSLFAFGGKYTPSTTYKWVGTAWASFGTGLSPTPGRAFHTMQEFGGKIVLFGGENQDGSSPRFLNDFWFFNGTNWDTYLGTKPSEGGDAGFANLAAVLALVVQSRTSSAPPSVWTWDGTSLTSKTISVSPPSVLASALGSVNGKAWAPGGRTVSAGVDVASMWSLVMGRADGSDCTTGTECTSAFCVDGVCCDTACAGTCQACTATLKGGGTTGVCGSIASGADPQAECKDEGSPKCGTDGTCDGAGACRKYTATTGCTPRACTTDTECASGFCTDGVCCDKRCNGSCEGCSKALKAGGIDGVCESFSAGTDPKDKCLKDTAVNSCNQDGMCDGAGVCRAYAITGTPCGETTCTSGSVSGRTCNGAGTCDTATVACGVFTCDATGKACRTTCTADGDCATTAYCATSGVCKAKSSNGTACTVAKECATGLCVDGVCCNSACGAQCESCSESGKEGTCVPVAGKPRGTREACLGGDSACAGKCDGIASSCTYPSASKDCGTTCASGTLTKRVCDNKGACVVSTTSCGNFACGDKACKETCTTATDCAGSGYNCEAGKCVPAGAATCTDDGLSVRDGDKVTSCAPTVCKGGKCVERCIATTDCSAGFTCDPSSGNCVAPTPPTEDDGGGCTMGKAAAREPGSDLGLVALVALGLLLGRRRRAA
jgi:hypothetical protein